jgi:methylenetetrahydrofolate dehydrogenase (NADP+) / methenyltetrahydrofolate cyclohydrolase
MAAKIIDGKKMADAILEKAKKEVARLSPKPCLAIVLVGDDPASQVYTKRKSDDCRKVGMLSLTVRLPAGASEAEIISQVRALSQDESVDGLLVQLPLPSGIDEDKILSEVSPEKDVDGFHPQNFGSMALGSGTLAPCTPKGVVYMLKQSGVKLEGKHAVVIGRSRIVGKPLALLLLDEDCTVTVCHSKTRDLAAITRSADIICSAVGKPGTVRADMIREGAVVIDIGTSREGEKLKGDVDFDSVKEKASLITPVPGGVGPMTRAMLVMNTLQCYRQRRGK